MFKLINKPVRYLLKVSVETLVVGWVIQHRQALVDRFKKKDPETPDTTRPIGDRFVPITADRGPSPYEEAVADTLEPVVPAVEAHLEEAASHVRIDT